MEKIACSNCGAEYISTPKICSRCGNSFPITNVEDSSALSKTNAPPKKGKGLLGAIFGIVSFVLAYWGVQQIFFKPPSFDKVMMEAASELNKTCPIMVDQYTRLDNAVALPDNVFQYNYTLVDIIQSEVNLDTVRKYIEPGIINNVKTNPDLKIYRDNKTTMVYYYKDKNGVFVFKLAVTPKMYE